MKTSDIVLGYGDRTLRGFIPQEWIDNGSYLPLALPPKSRPIADAAGALAESLERPVGGIAPFSSLAESCMRGGYAAVLVDDYTRPNDHTRLLLPLLVERLKERYGLPEEKIVVVVCAGTHRAPTEKEMVKMLGAEMASRLSVAVHDCGKDLVRVGEVEGKPVEICRAAFEADLVVPLTDVDNHYFAGIAGGPKAFCPGICGREIITWEHLHMFSDTGFADNVALGVLDGNPVYECKKKIVRTIIEALKKRGTEVYCLAAIMDPAGDLVFLKGGETFAVHREAAAKLGEIWTVTLPKRPGVVIAGAQTLGINLYQAGKAIHAAYNAVARGGHIMAAVPCPDSFGNEEYKRLMAIAAGVLAKPGDRAKAMREATAKVVEVVRRDFKIGKQKAVDFFRILEWVGWGHLHMIQDGLSGEDRKILPFEFWGDRSQPPEERLRSWVGKFGAGRTITVIDNPGYVVRVQ